MGESTLLYCISPTMATSPLNLSKLINDKTAKFRYSQPVHHSSCLTQQLLVFDNCCVSLQFIRWNLHTPLLLSPPSSALHWRSVLASNSTTKCATEKGDCATPTPRISRTGALQQKLTQAGEFCLTQTLCKRGFMHQTFSAFRVLMGALVWWVHLITESWRTLHVLSRWQCTVSHILTLRNCTI